MSTILTTARLVFKDTQARQKAIDAFHKIIEFTTSQEPDVLQYVCAIPKDDIERNEIYMIEEYANQAASDAHLTTKPVQDLISLFTSGDILSQSPEVHNCPIVAKKTSEPPLMVSSNPAIVLLNIIRGPRTAMNANEHWARYAEEAIFAIKALNVFLVVEDKDEKSTRVECVLQDWDAFAELRNTMAIDVNVSIDVINIVPIDGFIGREEKSRL